jgi:hypothetical protein
MPPALYALVSLQLGWFGPPSLILGLLTDTGGVMAMLPHLAFLCSHEVFQTLFCPCWFGTVILLISVFQGDRLTVHGAMAEHWV